MPKEVSEEGMYSQFSKIVCVSSYTASVFFNRYPTLKNRTFAIHNMIDYDRIISLADEKIADEKFVDDRYIILSVGRFAKEKRFHEIPRIASVLKASNMSFRWYIIGPEYGKPEVEQFNENLLHYKVDDCVCWLGGKTNPYPYFKKADLYVCTSESEACPMVFIEAKILGVPIVTTNFPSAYEFINDNDGSIVSFDELDKGIKNAANNTKREMFSDKSSNDKTLKQVKRLFN